MNILHYYREALYYGDTLAAKKCIKKRFKCCHNLYRKTILGHYGCVNSISFSNDGELFSSGGDDKRVLLWRTSHLLGVRKPVAISMKTEHLSNIFSTVFDCQKNYIFSAGMDENVFMHDIIRREVVGTYDFDEPVHSVDSPFDNPSLFAASGEDGTVQVIDVRTPTERVKLASSFGSYHSAVFSPIESQFIATANSKEGVALWDIRRPLKTLKDFSQKHKNSSAMSVRFDYLGRRILGLLRKGGPVLYDVGSESPLLYEFSDANYRNVCTMKTACFFGEKDAYISSGSDDFNVYVWKIPTEDNEGVAVTTPHFVLRGHRSIVNQVRYDKNQHVLATAGVEKCIKIWSCFPMIESKGDITNEERVVPRERYTSEQYTRLTFESGEMSHDYESGNTDEDPRILAMFDSLIERTKSDWASDTDSDSDMVHDSRVNAVLNLLFDRPESMSGSDVDDNDDANHDFGVSLDELRRIFRVNRRPPISQSPSSESSSPRTMVNLSPSLLQPDQQHNSNNQSQISTSTESTTETTETSCRLCNSLSSREEGQQSRSRGLVQTLDAETSRLPFHRRYSNDNEQCAANVENTDNTSQNNNSGIERCSCGNITSNSKTCMSVSATATSSCNPEQSGNLVVEKRDINTNGTCKSLDNSFAQENSNINNRNNEIEQDVDEDNAEINNSNGNDVTFKKSRRSHMRNYRNK